MGAESGSLEWRHSGVLAGRALGVRRLRLGCGMEGFQGGTPDRVAVGRGGVARSLGSLHVADQSESFIPEGRKAGRRELSESTCDRGTF